MRMAMSVSAQVFVFPSGVAVPDGTGSGVADRRTVSGAPLQASVTVGLTLTGLGEGMVNGDLYATLSHENASGIVDAFVVLLNRPGKRLDNDEGYFDSGMSIDLVGDPSAPDIHNYRVTLGGSHTLPLGGPLTGTWSPDGRGTDPELVLDTDERSSGLDAFTGIDPNTGRWVLFVADLVLGGEARLDSWSLGFSPVAVPEPQLYALGAGVGLAVLALVRRLWTARSEKCHRR
ncbi:MAG: PEP-CTERM sorting domain-containing protein [Limisphaerales bacterium]